jgi:hypothetical protein
VWRVGDGGFRSRSGNSWLIGETVKGKVRLTVRRAGSRTRRLTGSSHSRTGRSSAAARSAPRASRSARRCSRRR